VTPTGLPGRPGGFDSRPSVIVAGGGHNGLVCAAYLARAGLDVEVVEARPSVGGCASTVDAVGARVNVCNCDHTLVRASGVLEELDLAVHGLRYLELEPAAHAVTVGAGPAWWSFADVERTLEAIALSHPGQVDPYRRYLEAMTPVARLMLELTSSPPSPGRVLHRLAGRGAASAGRLLRVGRARATDVLRSFFSDEALIAPCAASGPAVWGLDPARPGTGLGALGYALRHLAPPGRPVGGSGALPAALGAAVEAAGGRVRTGARVVALCCEADRVTGVALEGGELLGADAVVCAADPRTAVVEWLGPTRAGAGMVARWRDRPALDGYEAKIDAVVERSPRYLADDPETAERLGVGDPCVPTTVITPTAAGISRARAAADGGRVADQPVMFVNVPGAADPSMAVPGGHVLSLEVLFTPYRVSGGWDASTEPRRWLDVLGRHLCPGSGDGIRAWRVVTPIDYERDFGLRRGHAPSFPGGPLAALVGRDRELTRYETPVTGLFLTGAGTFPGAGVWGASGRNAAHVVLRRLGASPPG
jgi:phytoene dehydrogenase-like protein